MSLHPGVVAGVFVLVVLTAGVAVLSLYLVWRNGFVHGWRASRGAPPTCPACGYNLSGLRQCRCPECGAEYSLDQLSTFVPEGSVRRAVENDG